MGKLNDEIFEEAKWLSCEKSICRFANGCTLKTTEYSMYEKKLSEMLQFIYLGIIAISLSENAIFHENVVLQQNILIFIWKI